MPSPIRIVHICSSPIRMDGNLGGVSNVVRELSLRSSSQDIETTIICGNRELGVQKSPIGIVRPNDNLKIITLNGSPKSTLGLVRDLLKTIAAFPKNTAFHVHAGFSPLTDISMAILSLYRRKFIYSPHGKLSPGMINNRRFYKELYFNIALNTLINQASILGIFADREVSDHFGRKINCKRTVIPNGFSPPPTPAVERIYDFRYILYLGYLDPRKQPGFLLQAYKRSNIKDEVKLILAGPDSYGHQKELKELAEHLDIYDDVIFHGGVYGDEKTRILRDAEALCLPSLAEGMPLVLVEAVGMGLPSIFSRESNGDLIASSGAGIELDKFSDELWGETIRSLCKDTLARDSMSKKAKSLAPHLEWEFIAKSWISTYGEISR